LECSSCWRATILRHDPKTARRPLRIRNQLTGFDLAGKTLRHWSGRIGSRVAKKAALGLDMKVIAYSPSARAVDEWIEWWNSMNPSSLRFSEPHLPSRHRRSTSSPVAELARMKHTAYASTRRAAMWWMKGSHRGFANRTQLPAPRLDVFEQEPPLCTTRFRDDNVVVTPHSAALTVERCSVCFSRPHGRDEVLLRQAPRARHADSADDEPHNPRI
jgi:D-3-phosphoglycerate dehydrogenase